MGRNNKTDKKRGNWSRYGKLHRNFGKSDKSEKEIEAEMINALSVKLNITVEELKVQYTEFMTKYPRGKINKAECEAVFEQRAYFSLGSLFGVVDEDNNGFMDFQEFTMASYCMNLILPEKNLCCIFENSEKAEKDLDKVIISLLTITEDEIENVEIVESVKIVFEKVDEGGDVIISTDKFGTNDFKVNFINKNIPVEK